MVLIQLLGLVDDGKEKVVDNMEQGLLLLRVPFEDKLDLSLETLLKKSGWVSGWV